MDFQEECLREMLESPFDAGVVQSLLDRVDLGEDVVIHYADGSSTALSPTCAAARTPRVSSFVRRFRWRT